MEFDKTRWFYPLNNDQNCTQNTAGCGGGGFCRSRGGGGSGGLREAITGALFVEISGGDIRIGGAIR